MSGSVSRDAEALKSADSSTRRSGGRITFPFMIVTLFGLTLATLGWLQNLIVYLIEEYNMKSIAAAKILNIFSGFTFMFPAIGAIAADSFFGTIPVILVSSFISLVGVVLLALTTLFDSLRPQACETASSLCQAPTNIQLGVLYTAITLGCVGAGGLRFTLATAGANQYEKAKDQGSFFNWFFFTWYLAASISATAIVYAEENISWSFGFGLCVAANLFGLIVFILGKRFYKHDKPLGSPFTSLLRVIFVAIRKRKAVVSTNEKDYHSESKKAPTKSFRVGIGHVFNILSMAVTAIVEAKRLKIVQNGHLLESSSVADMSVLWLFPPLVIVGIGEAFHFPGNVALCYQEFPESMRSTATSITSVLIGICFYTSTALIDLIQRTTAWLPDDINHGRVDNVYWILVIGGVLNFGYFLMGSWFYKYRNLDNADHEQAANVSH
ncbi:unnamed protein product [Arabidopsis thaliana]|uniref:(thale cress) hypothetical protein n=1 Tax=Arabidopsis thaliana TaxID=3702 RepID=A0A7G2EQF0_ARATH|nr:unnamed protein product [Arabidopsis thaliana]